MTPQWNADIITPEEKGSGTQVLGDNQQVQTTLESGSNITIEDGKISASGTLENVQADWTENNPESPSYIIRRPNLATVATSGDYGDLSNKPDLSVYATTSAVADKADKVSGAVSGNLAGLDSNGNLTDSGVAAANLVHDAAYVHTDNNFSDSDAAKLAGIAAGAEVNVQASWTETDTSSDSYIIGKPDLSIYAQSSSLATVATTGSYDDLTDKPTIPPAVTVDQTYNASSTNPQSGIAVAGAIANKQDTISDLATIRSGAEAGATAVQPSSLAAVATSGAYSDLSGTPTIPSGDQLVPSATSSDNGKVLTVDNNGDPAWVTPSAGTVYTAGDGVDITNGAISADVDGTTIGIDSSTKKIKLLSAIPTVDQAYSASSTNAQSGTAVAGAIAGKQDTISDLATIRTGAGLGATAVQPGDLATVATSGSYNDLSDKPTIPAAVTVDQTYNASSANAQSGVAVAGAISTKQDTISDLATIRSGASAGSTAVQPGDLATVATTGAYSDLSGTPTIPSGDELVPSASSSDAGKVLTVDNNGDPSWVTPSAGTVYTAGDGVDITNNVISADVDGTTIGIDSSTKKIKLLSAIPTVDQTYSASSQNAQSGVAVASAISTKQDTIADLATIRSGASAGATAVQPGDLATVATTGAYSDLSGTPTIPVVDQTYSASSTNAQSGVAVAEAVAAISVDEVPAVTSSDDGKVLKATYSGGTGSYAWATESGGGGTTYTAGDGIDISNDTISADVDGTTIGIDSSTKKIKLLSSIPTVDQSYSASSTNAQSGTAVAGAIATVKQVPASTSSDSTKVLTVNSSGTPVWAAAQGGTVDQVYNASSTNAQSGTAVAGALAAVPTKPIVAGSNITITENTTTVTIDAQVDQIYSSSSTHAQSGVAVASAISTAIGPIETALSNL